MSCPAHGPRLRVSPNHAKFDPGVVPTEVLEYVTKKGVKPSFSYQDVWNQEHSTAFAVAKATELDVIESMQQAVAEALREGLPFTEFQKRITPILADKGWWGRQSRVDPITGEEAEVQLGSPARLKLIYDTNVRTARAAGQWQRIEAAKKALPYLRYRHGNPERPRPDHVAWDGRVLPVDHPWWNYAYPPNGYRCTCWVEQVSNFQAKKLGVTPDDEVDTEPIVVKNTRTGATTTTIKGVQPTFAYNAGKNRNAGLVQAGVIKRPAKGKKQPTGADALAQLERDSAEARRKALQAEAEAQAAAQAKVYSPDPISPQALHQLAKVLQAPEAQAGNLDAARQVVRQQVSQALPRAVRSVQAQDDAIIDQAQIPSNSNAVHEWDGQIIFDAATGRQLQGPRPTVQADLDLLRAQLSDFIGQQATPQLRAQRQQVVDQIAILESRLHEDQAWHDSVRIFVHEELHGWSPTRTTAAAKYLYTDFGAGAVVEEVTTEILARALVPQAQSKSYERNISEMAAAVVAADTAPQPVTLQAARDILVRASARFKGRTQVATMGLDFALDVKAELPSVSVVILEGAIFGMYLDSKQSQAPGKKGQP